MTYAEMDEQRAGVPALKPTPGGPLDRSRPTRLPLEWDGQRWAARDPASGYVLEVGGVDGSGSDQDEVRAWPDCVVV